MVIGNSTPLKGIVLAGRAKANADAGIMIAARKCGYGSNTNRFSKALQSACADTGIETQALSNLIAEQQRLAEQKETNPVAVVGWRR
ncbi:MAG: hypothetical protein AAF282_00390 [Cyanobacteria bacterium P01_A01_bin.15]